MADDEEQRTAGLLPYDEWTAEALRQVVASAVAHAAQHGLPGEHHFYITFRTRDPGVVIPPRLRAQYSEVMTIVLQHQFWDLKMDPGTASFSVGLSFGGVPTTLAIPLSAITAFADPAVGFALEFRDNAGEGAPRAIAGPEPPEGDADKGGPDGRGPNGDGADVAPEKPQVVSLEAFRRRTPPNKT